MLEDALKNTDQVIMWSVDPNTTTGYPGQDSLIWRIWLRELGIKLIFIDPWCNFTASMLADKWIAPRPGTDAALAEAIAYVWIKEGTYDKWFVENRTVGFDEFKKHILGEEDGIPRTPGWAAEISRHLPENGQQSALCSVVEPWLVWEGHAVEPMLPNGRGLWYCSFQCKD
jgi:anaerobic selenocysteine-containing dehydrogenase